MHFFVMKSEPTSYSIADLAREGVTPWEGVRNYQARNIMRDLMQVGDTVFLYHSNSVKIGIVGEGRVASPPHPDETQFNPKSQYYDPKSTRTNPRWFCVDVAYVCTYPRIITLTELANDPMLTGLTLTKKGNRLSVMPIATNHGTHIQTISRAS
jgi:predicted RNA-binding protein with PUA-like domain